MPTLVNPGSFKSQFGPLPRQAYRVQILDVKQDINAKNKCPQDLFELEIVAPDSVTGVDGTSVGAAGRLLKMYITYSAKNLANCRDIVGKLGCSTQDDWNIPSEEEVVTGSYTTIPEIQDQTRGAIGMQFDVVLETEPSYKRLAPAAGQSKFSAALELDSQGRPIVSGHNFKFIRHEDIETPMA